MVVYMKLLRDGTTMVYDIYRSYDEAARMVKVLNTTTDKWEFFTK